METPPFFLGNSDFPGDATATDSVETLAVFPELSESGTLPANADENGSIAEGMTQI